MLAVIATRDVTTQCRCPAALDRAHRLHLVEADVSAVSITPRGAVVAEYVRNFQGWPSQGASRLVGLPLSDLQLVQRAHDPANNLRCHARIVRRRIEPVVTE